MRVRRAGVKAATNLAKLLNVSRPKQLESSHLSHYLTHRATRLENLTLSRHLELKCKTKVNHLMTQNRLRFIG